jgi:murein DD-endopeptidase MepM/ murein hydrolase activator NlpD
MTMRRLVLLTLVGLASSCASPTAPAADGKPSWVPAMVSCAVFQPSASSSYVLPFASGQQFRVSRTFSHYLPSNGGVGLYAIDVLMPMGTPVHAIRAGRVVAVEEGFSDDDHATYHENWVMVRHEDNTVARYIHLMVQGAAVAVGDVVAQGQLVGYSGNSGASNEPHLHFDVQTCGPNLPPGYNDAPCGMTVPLSFRNTTEQSCGLEPGKTYRAN